MQPTPGELVKSGKRPTKVAITRLEYRIEDYKRMLHWPALIESLERDLAILKARAAEKR